MYSKDLNKLTKIIKTENNGLPIFLFSHSMGSFAAQKYIIDYKGRHRWSNTISVQMGYME
ncbi:alpha/beta hydrolase [Paraclostridium bifermentans]|nr:alpha/beta hydrolase [Paraclostridium bifermentans]